MWPVLLNMTRDDCRRTLRRLELEAYSNMISVFRAQGALEDNRRRILQELRDVLHIGGDRHSAEARRVANDELLATIAEQLSGPNTGLDWISEGRRRVPLMPRGIPQTVFTELADMVALQAKAENEELKKKKEAERLAASQAPPVDLAEEKETENPQNVDFSDEMLYPPVVMEDQAIKILEKEALAGRKRKITESSLHPDDVATTPVSAVKNLNRPSNQKHLNLSQIYSNFSKTPSGKNMNQTKHSYNQVSKVSSKSNQTPRIVKRRKQNPSDKPQKSASKPKKMAIETPVSSKQYVNPTSMPLDYPPSSFQASYAQTVLGRNSYGDEAKSQNMTESQTMKLLTTPVTTPRELEVSQPENTPVLQAQSSPVKTPSSKPCQFIIKKKPIEKTPQNKVQISDVKILKKSDGIKVLPKKQIVVAPNAMQRTPIASGKLIQNKIVHNTIKTPTSLSSPTLDKMVVVSGGHPMVKTTGKAKNIIIAPSNVTAPITKSIVVDSNNISPKIAEEHTTPKGIPANDVKVSTKTFLLNPKSGQKMVVLPAKNRTGTETQSMSMLQFKNMTTTMKLVPVSSTMNQISKSNSNITIVSRGTGAQSNTKIVGLEVKPQDANKPKLQGVQIGAKVTAGSPMIRPVTSKGSVIVVQKAPSMGKTLTFPKSGGEMSKIVMGKNVNKLMKAQGENSPDKKPGNVIVLDLNDQLGPTTMSKIIDSHAAKTNQEESNKSLQAITEDTPVLFDGQMTEETCNANSLDSLSTVDMGQLEEGTVSSIDKEEGKSVQKEMESVKDTSSVTDWEMELDNSVGRKRKGGSSSSLHLELCMSSDSETDAYLVKEKPKKKTTEEHTNAREEPSSIFGDRSGLSLATRTLFSQLQDEGSSSNDSSYVLKNKLTGKATETSSQPSDEKSIKTAKDEVKTQVKRLDMFGPADMQLSAFGYLESDEGMLSGEDMFGDAETDGKNGARSKETSSLDLQLSQFLGESSEVNSLPLNK